MQEIPREIIQAIKEQSKIHGLSFALVAAVCEKESGFIPDAMRMENGFLRRYVNEDNIPDEDLITGKHQRAGNPQAGLSVPFPIERLQLSTSWGLMQIMGMTARENGCTVPWFSVFLDNPTEALYWGCHHLKRLTHRYPNIEDALCAYNAGNAKSARGREYAKQVLAKMERWEG